MVRPSDQAFMAENTILRQVGHRLVAGIEQAALENGGQAGVGMEVCCGRRDHAGRMRKGPGRPGSIS
ncbi:Uncharacterised protein [Bordetella pertussis]|nr:Uncharacterised protein [Bordetella pertussis]